jgi:hypothetical protein
MKMANHIDGILKEFADIQRDIRDLAMSATAQRLALYDLVPNFAEHYSEHLSGPEATKIRGHYDHAIHALLSGLGKNLDN